MDPTRRYPTVAPAHDTGRQAESLVEHWLANDWLVRPLGGQKDYGFDYLVEAIAEQAGQRFPSGQVFCVQLKGMHEVVCDADGKAGVALETSTVRYYVEKVELPVFLFVVDTTAERGWFSFIQGSFFSEEMAQKLETQKTVTLYTRLDDRIEKQERLLTAVNSAMICMRNRHPGSIDAALHAAARRFETIDPRFHAKIEVVQGHQTLFLSPKEKVSFSLAVRAESASRVGSRIDELFRFGCHIELTTDDVIFTNFPHADLAMAEGKRVHVAFEPAPAIEAEVTLRGGKGADAFDLKFTGVIHGGSDGISFEARLENCPLVLSLRVPKEVMNKAGGGGRFNTSWDFSQWAGKPLESLPWLEPVAAFWRVVVAGQDVDVLMTNQGNRLSRGSIKLTDASDEFQSLNAVCDFLWKSRELAFKRGFKLVVPSAEGLAECDFDGIEMAYNLEMHGRYERAAPNIRLALGHAPAPMKGDPSALNPEGTLGDVRAELRPLSVNAFNQVLDCGDACIDLVPAIWRSDLPDAGGEVRTSEVVGVPTTRMTVKRPVEPAEGVDNSHALPGA